ncbi:MAG: hypothetical protein DCC75_08160 [Proteobacteria bacterium]|nr:MAG: hypothetical protein DCC75_08160 [Pseudomonadota bacterium]
MSWQTSLRKLAIFPELQQLNVKKQDSNPDSNRFTRALAALSKFFDAHSIGYCLIGGVAVQIRGQPRFTRDIDVTILVEIEREAELVDLILRTFSARLEEAREFALQNKVILIEVEAVPVDIGVGLTSFEHRAVRRAVREKLAKDLEVPVCLAEDLIIHKVLASRDSDWPPPPGARYFFHLARSNLSRTTRAVRPRLTYRLKIVFSFL